MRYSARNRPDQTGGPAASRGGAGAARRGSGAASRSGGCGGRGTPRQGGASGVMPVGAVARCRNRVGIGLGETRECRWSLRLPPLLRVRHV
eukprot:scaffold12988_cov112-Isochrysis_galbana.AAC.7